MCQADDQEAPSAAGGRAGSADIDVFVCGCVGG